MGGLPFNNGHPVKTDAALPSYEAITAPVKAKHACLTGINQT
jgi:hypothetical protein